MANKTICKTKKEELPIDLLKIVGGSIDGYLVYNHHIYEDKQYKDIGCDFRPYIPIT